MSRKFSEVSIRPGSFAVVGVVIWFAMRPALAGDVLPSGGSVAAGSVSIARPNSSTLNVNQSTNQAIINWNSFSVGRGDTVNFNQPGASSATLNRVTGSAPSWLAGTINAPGTVLLVNPNGIAITRSGVVNTGSFAASTLGIKDSDFLSGHYSFSGNGGSAGVVNSGRINVSDGGFAALLGGQVSNNGVIAARLGRVGLGAGEQATLDLSGDGFLSVAVPSSELGHFTTANGALVNNKGKIEADGGTVFLSAATASNILRNAVNMGGTVQANSVGMHDGRIVINGGGGDVNVTGKLVARSRKGTGGEVDITSAGAGVKLAGARVDVSGKTGGGAVNVGGGPHATAALAEAQSVSIDAATMIKADATDNGNGGHIVVWSGGQTTAKGTFSAKGGRNGGNGGLVETSGHAVDFNGITVNASAAQGAAGTWLVDPTDLTIDSAAASTIGSMLGNGTNVMLQTNADGTTSGPGHTNAGNGDIVVNSNITWNSNAGSTLTLQSVHDIDINASICCGGLSLLASGSVTTASLSSIDTSGTMISAGGNITINGFAILTGATSFSAGGNIVISSQSTLGTDPTLTAGGNIQLNLVTTSGGSNLSAFGNISLAGMQNSNGGAITLQADNTGTGSGTVSISGLVSIAGANVSIYYDPASYTSPTNYSSQISGGSVTAYMLVNNYNQLKAIGGNLNGNYALGRDIDASASGRDNSGFGWSGLGSSPNGPGTPYSGSFDGQNHVISGLAGMTAGALFYEIGSSGRISNLGVVNANLLNSDGNPEPMGIIARYNAGTLSNVYTSGHVDGGVGNVGGLVGENSAGGLITGGSYSTASVVADGGSASAGGLVGQNYGTIQNSYSDGSVHAALEVGGIVGINWGTVTDVYSLSSVGVVNGGDAGGIAGMNGFTLNRVGIISYSWAAGSLPCACGVNHVGGIVGLNDYLDRINIGNNAPNVDDWNSNPSAKTALVYNSYWDVDTTHATTAYSTDYIPYRPNGPYVISNLYNLGALSTNSAVGANPYQIGSYGYFYNGANGNAFSQTWFMVPGATRPFLAAEFSNTIENSHQLQLVDMNSAANYTLGKDITFNNDGMWSSAGFSPITGIGETTFTYLTYQGYTIFGDPSTTTTTNGNVITTVIISRDLFNRDPQLVNTRYEVDVSQTGLFSGTFNGNGHTITGLTENLSGMDGGLFDVNAGTIENLGLINPSITTHDTSAAGTIAAFNVGTIVDSWASSTNKSNLSLNVWNAKSIGGLVGYNSGQIAQSYTDVAVAGVNQSTDPTTPSAFFDMDGGLAGVNEGVISNSYAIGNVYGNGSVGGLVGFNEGTIQNTYTTGVVGANWLFGINSANALVGNNAGTVTNSFWDSTVATVKSGAGTGLTTSQLQNFSTYASVYTGWDFNNVWAPPNQANQAGLSAAYYPQLYADTPVVFVHPGSASTTYGQSGPSVSATMAGGAVDYKFDPAADSMATPGVTTAATQTSNVGTYVVSANVGSTMTSRFGVTYRVIQDTGAIVIAPATLTVTPNEGSATYNGVALSDPAYSDNVNNYSITGFANGQSAATTGISFTGSMAFNGSTTASVLNAGAYSLSQGTLAMGSTNSNYVFAFANPDSHSYVINPATLTYTANSASMSYGGAVPGLTGTLTGFVGNDNMANSTTGSLAFMTSVTALSNAGSYAISGSGLARNNPNYTFAQASSNATAFTVTKALLTVTGDKTYDASSGFTSSQLSVMGGVNGQTITLTGGTGTSSSADAGTYSGSSLSGLTISVTGGSGTDLASNYQLPTNGTLSIDKATLILTGSRTYDGTTAFSASAFGNNGTISTGIGGETLTVTGAGSVASPNVIAGAQALTLGTLQLTNGTGLAANYVIAANNNTGTISPASVTVTANGGSSIYGDSPTNPGLSATGLQHGEGVDALTGLSNSFGITNTTNAGIHTLSVVGTLSNPNYTVTTTKIGSWTVSPATLSLAGIRNYDGTVVFSASSFGNGGTINTGINGETLVLAGAGSVLSPNVSAGMQTLALGTLQLTNGTGFAGNYVIAANSNAGTINPAPLTLIANGGSSIYGDSPTNPGLSATGLQHGEGVDVLTGLSNSFNISNTTNAGTYTVTVLGTLSNPNYMVTATNPGSWQVNPASITVTANGGSSIYGQSPSNPGLSATGLQNGEGVDVLTGLSNSFSITNLTNVGRYALNVFGTLTNANYTVTARNVSSWFVDPATLVYVADSSTQFAGSAFPGFTGTVTGFVNGQTLADATTGRLSFDTTATPRSAPVSYAINGSGLSANFGNYVFRQDAGNATALTLHPAPSNPPSQSTPGFIARPSNQVTINFTNPTTTDATPSTGAASSSNPVTGNSPGDRTGDDVKPASRRQHRRSVGARNG